MSVYKLTTIKDSEVNGKPVNSSSPILQDHEKPEKTCIVQVEERPLWDNKIQFLLAAIGFAVGLGNIWRFPWLCQKNGGGAFLIPYFVMLIIEGVPMFFLELSIGQRLQQGSIRVWSTVSPYLGGVGIASTIVCILVGSYYNVVIAWVLYYFYNSFQSPLPWANCPKLTVTDLITNTTTRVIPSECSKSSPTAYFFHREALQHANSIDDPLSFNWKMAICLVVAWILSFLCILKGIKSSGKVVYFTATFPYLVLTCFFVRGLLLKGSSAGIIHLFTPKWERLQDPIVWLDAATQIFFSLGVAFGAMVAYASYNNQHENTLRDAITISLANSATSLFAGVVVFSILGFRGTLLMEKCEQSRLEILNSVNSTVNATMSSINTTGMSALELDWLRGNATLNATRALPQCDMGKFITEAAGGPGLCFIAFTDAINQMPGSIFWSLIFFLMLLTLGLDSLFGALESVTTALHDLAGLNRLRKEVISAMLCLAGLCIGLTMVTNSGEYVLQLFDSFAGNLPLLVIAILECIGVCYCYGINRFCDDIENMTGYRPGFYWKMCWMFVTPLSMFAILVASIYIMSQGHAVYYAWIEELATYRPIPYPIWAISLIIILILSSTLFIPGVALARFSGCVSYTKSEPEPLPKQEFCKTKSIRHENV